MISSYVYFNTLLIHLDPKLPELLEIVIPKVANYWDTLAHFLEFEVQKVQIISEQHPNDPKESCTEVFAHWLNSDEGIIPKTWGVLLETLKKITELTAVTEQIETELKQRELAM